MVEPTKNHQKGRNKELFMGPSGPRSPPVDRWLMIPELLKKTTSNDEALSEMVSSGNQTWPMDNSL